MAALTTDRNNLGYLLLEPVELKVESFSIFQPVFSATPLIDSEFTFLTGESEINLSLIHI